jgi:hypothetical protein
MTAEEIERVEEIRKEFEAALQVVLGVVAQLRKRVEQLEAKAK